MIIVQLVYSCTPSWVCLRLPASPGPVSLRPPQRVTQPRGGRNAGKHKDRWEKTIRNDCMESGEKFILTSNEKVFSEEIRPSEWIHVKRDEWRTKKHLTEGLHHFNIMNRGSERNKWLNLCVAFPWTHNTHIITVPHRLFYMICLIFYLIKEAKCRVNCLFWIWSKRKRHFTPSNKLFEMWKSLVWYRIIIF